MLVRWCLASVGLAKKTARLMLAFAEVPVFPLWFGLDLGHTQIHRGYSCLSIIGRCSSQELLLAVFGTTWGIDQLRVEQAPSFLYYHSSPILFGKQTQS